MKTNTLLAAALVGAQAFTSDIVRAADPLPSWNDGKPKQSSIAFVEKVTRQGSSDFVPMAERIATFDNDGGLTNEFIRGFKGAFHVGRVATVFGSARFKASHPCHDLARATDAELAKAGMEITP